MTESQHLESFIIPSKTPLLFLCRIARVSTEESSSREERRRPRRGYLNLGISRSLVDSCLDCRAHEVTFPHIITKFFGYDIRDVRASIVKENEWPSYEQLMSVLVLFSAKF